MGNDDLSCEQNFWHPLTWLSLMADRYTYIPLIGLFIVVVWGVADLLRGWRHGRAVGVVAATAVLSALMVVTWFQVQRWRDSITIFTHALKVTEANYLVHNILGTALLQDGRIADAMFHFEEAVRIKLDYAEAFNNLHTVQKMERVDKRNGDQ